VVAQPEGPTTAPVTATMGGPPETLILPPVEAIPVERR
jgi:hypothetical protein